MCAPMKYTATSVIFAPYIGRLLEQQRNLFVCTSHEEDHDPPASSSDSLLVLVQSVSII